MSPCYTNFHNSFVVACCRENEDPESGFCVFRTYKTEQTSRLNPADIRISQAFAAAGAKKGFLYPFKLPSATGSILRFGTEIIPEYFTNATTYALKEVRQQFGVDGVIPAIINIGPGIPHFENVKKWEKMRETFPWHSHRDKPLLTSTKDNSKPKGGLHDKENSAKKEDHSTEGDPSATRPKRSSLVSRLLRHSVDEKRIKRSWSILENIKSSTASTELQIQRELQNFDRRATYVRLVLDKGPKLTACSDLMTSQEMQKCTEDYLSSDEAKSSMNQYRGAVTLESSQAGVVW